MVPQQQLLALAAIVRAAHGVVQLAPLFRDGFVLQDYYMFDSRSFVFGSAAPGENIRLSLMHDANSSLTKAYESVADATTGRWITQIDPDYFNAVAAGQVSDIGSRTLTLTVAGSTDGFQKLQTVYGVRYGDVFLCAGGGEMARPLAASADGQALLRTPPRSVRVFTAADGWAAAADMPPTTLAQVSAACFAAAAALPQISSVYARNRTVALILATAPDSGSIEGWLPGGGAFERLLRPHAHFALRGVLWSHGAEALPSGAARGASFNGTAYGQVLTRVVEGLRVAWGQGDIAFVSAQASALPGRTAAQLAALRTAQSVIAPTPGGATALSGLVCTHDLGDLSPPQRSKAGSDSELGRRLATQVLHVQWGWASNMSTSPAARAAGLQSVDWRALTSCRNASLTELLPAAPVLPATVPSMPRLQPLPQKVAATPP